MPHNTQVSDEQLHSRSDLKSVWKIRMMLAYTSGTTGHPKRELSTATSRSATPTSIPMHLGHNRNDVHLSYLPLFHAYGFSEVARMVKLTGRKPVLFDVFEPDQVLDAVEEEGGTVLLRQPLGRPYSRTTTTRTYDVTSLRVGTLPAGMESTVPIAQQVQDISAPPPKVAFGIYMEVKPGHSLPQAISQYIGTKNQSFRIPHVRH